MKVFILLVSTLFTFQINANQGKKSHFSRDVEKKCWREMRSFSCGDPDVSLNAYIDCIDEKKMSLSVICQGFLQDEIDSFNNE